MKIFRGLLIGFSPQSQFPLSESRIFTDYTDDADYPIRISNAR